MRRDGASPQTKARSTTLNLRRSTAFCERSTERTPWGPECTLLHDGPGCGSPRAPCGRMPVACCASSRCSRSAAGERPWSSPTKSRGSNPTGRPPTRPRATTPRSMRRAVTHRPGTTLTAARPGSTPRTPKGEGGCPMGRRVPRERSSAALDASTRLRTRVTVAGAVPLARVGRSAPTAAAQAYAPGA
jgi:hypothetical protein